VNAERNSRVLIILFAVVVSSIFTTIAISVASALFALSRILLPALYKLPFIPFILRPFTGHFLRGPWTFSLPLRHFGLLARAWLLGFSTFISWEISECLFEKIVAEVKSL
jgi:nucleoporin NDC1